MTKSPVSQDYETGLLIDLYTYILYCITRVNNQPRKNLDMSKKLWLSAIRAYTEATPVIPAKTDTPAEKPPHDIELEHRLTKELISFVRSDDFRDAVALLKAANTFVTIATSNEGCGFAESYILSKDGFQCVHESGVGLGAAYSRMAGGPPPPPAQYTSASSTDVVKFCMREGAKPTSIVEMICKQLDRIAERAPKPAPAAT